MTTGAASACPQCGAPLRFGGAHSLAACCAYCRTAVLRKGADLEIAGRVPDLVAVDTRLALGTTGTAGADRFTILGRLQLSRGDATWNEWYAAFPRGFGWIAEAQGRLFVTRLLERASGLPAFSALRPGAVVEVAGVGPVTVDEVASATLASFEGELPFRPSPGAAYRYADASGPDGSFVTLDYGTGEGDPELFAGRELPWSSVEVPGGPAAPAAAGERATALACPSCGAPVSLARPLEARTATCQACRSVLDVSKGSLRVVEVLESRAKPPIPLGARGKLRGEDVEVLGWLRRSSVIEGTTYPWDELLLHGPGGYRWLSTYGGHWVFLRPIPAGKVTTGPGQDVVCEGRRFRHFQSATARTEALQGEFYWELRAGEAVWTEDYVAPPHLLSSERDAHEVAWTLGEDVPGDELWKALGLGGSPPRAVGVGAAQPNAWSKRSHSAFGVAAVAMAALLVGAAVFAVRAKRERVVEVDVPLTATEVAPLEPFTASRVTLTEPFEIGGTGPQAVRIEAAAGVDQAWVGLDVALINDETGESDVMGIELSHYHGVEGGEAWSEGSRLGHATAGGIRPGRYVLRVEPVLEGSTAGVPPYARVRVVRDVFLVAPLLLALAAVLAWPLFCLARVAAFERARWEESDHPWGGSDGSAGPEDDE